MSKIPIINHKDIKNHLILKHPKKYHQYLKPIKKRNKASNLDEITLFSPSKINLFLRVINKRSDGYHDLASLFHIISLNDEIQISTFDTNELQQDKLICNQKDIPTDQSNLIIKALNLFRSKSQFKNQYFNIKLKKNIPSGAGLGGGSGNAATTLWAANRLTGNYYTEDDLLKWSGDIGSDISVFFSKGAAFCTGRGEIVEDIKTPIPMETQMVLIKPNESLSTGKIFRKLDLTKCSDKDPLLLLNEIKLNGKIHEEYCVNDLEIPAFEILPKLRQLKEKLKESNLYDAVFMTGSGSTIVCIGSDLVPDEITDYGDLFISKARFIIRNDDEWYS